MTTSPAHLLAPYAVPRNAPAHRRNSEPPDPLRGPFEVDRRRIIECTAFRRLEYKTQVFAPGLHDHFRTRLTHTLETAQIARCLADNLGANEALCEAIALAHDLGHPPFGHAGEAALNEAMAGQGGFDHNAHSVRVVEYLEHPFPAFRGVNLTLETLAGLQSHATRYDRPAAQAHRLPPATNPRPEEPFRREGVPSVESQIASLADRIAYNVHDLEDAIGAELLQLDDLALLPIWSESFASATQNAEVIHIHAVRRMVLNTMLDRILTDAIASSRVSLAPIDSPDAAAPTIQPLVFLSPACEAQLRRLEQFLGDRVYHHPIVARADADARRMIRSLFDEFLTHPNRLPKRFAERVPDQGPHRVIGDYIAGMTDRFCIGEHQRVTGGGLQSPI